MVGENGSPATPDWQLPPPATPGPDPLHIPAELPERFELGEN